MDVLQEVKRLWRRRDPEGSEAALRALRAKAEGPPEVLLQIDIQIARAQGLRGDFAGGHATLDAVEGALAQPPPVIEVRCLLERGRLFNSAGDKKRARPLFLRALERAQASGLELYAVDAAHMVAIAADSPQDEIAWNERAVALAEAARDPDARAFRAAIYNNLGWTHDGLGHAEEALRAFELALPFHEQSGDEHRIYFARYSVAHGLRKVGRCAEALSILTELEATQTAAGDGWLQAELGECHIALGDAAAGRAHCARALELLEADPHAREHDAAVIARLRELSAAVDVPSGGGAAD